VVRAFQLGNVPGPRQLFREPREYLRQSPKHARAVRQHHARLQVSQEAARQWRLTLDHFRGNAATAVTPIPHDFDHHAVASESEIGRCGSLTDLVVTAIELVPIVGDIEACS